MEEKKGSINSMDYDVGGQLHYFVKHRERKRLHSAIIIVMWKIVMWKILRLNTIILKESSYTRQSLCERSYAQIQSGGATLSVPAATLGDLNVKDLTLK